MLTKKSQKYLILSTIKILISLILIFFICDMLSAASSLTSSIYSLLKRKIKTFNLRTISETVKIQIS